MSLSTNVQDLATRVGTECKSIRTLVNGNAADLSGLNTIATDNLVNAINEILAAVSAASGIDDGMTSTSSTWSSQKISDDLADKADLVGGKVPSAQLPAFVDDVLEYANTGAFPGTGSAGIIYVALDTNKTYRWGGSSYTEISASPGTTDSLTEGSTNLYFTTARAKAAAVADAITDAVTDVAPSQNAVYDALAAKQNLDATLTALAGLATGANKLAYSTGTDTFAQTDLTSFARTLLDDADAATALATLGAAAASDLSALSTAVGSTSTNYVTTFEAALV